MKIFRLAVVGVILSLLVSSCYKTEDTYLDELDLTLTYYDTAFNFQQYNTFAIRDSVGVVSNYLDEKDLADFYKPGGANDQIKAYVRDKFTALGYTEVASDDDFDFGVNLVVLLVDNTVVYYPGWWYSYYDYYNWYWWGWYPYYPYYPWGGYYAYNYQTGTLLMEMADGESIRVYREWAENYPGDIEDAPPNEVPDILFRWQSLINGIAGSTASYNKERTERGVDEAFVQSPYLKKN